MRLTPFLFLLTAAAASSAPVPSREITADLEPAKTLSWEWRQGETVFLDLTCRKSEPRRTVRDLTGSTCYGVVYDGTNNYLYTTGTVYSATGGVVRFTVTAAQSNLETNDYKFEFFAAGSTSSAYLGRAELEVKYAPDASAPRVAALDYVPTASILTGAVYSTGGALPVTSHVLYVTVPAASVTYGHTNNSAYRGDWGAAASNLAASATSASAITNYAYPLADGQAVSNLAASAMAAVASTGTAAAAANVATSNSIAGAVTAGTSGLSVVYYPLDWGNIVSNLAAAGGGSVTLGDVTNTITALVPPLIAGGTTLAATTATYAASAGYATNAGEAAHATNSDTATSAGSATEAVTAQSSTNALQLGGTPAAEWAMQTNRYTSLWFTMPNTSPGTTRLWQDPDYYLLWYIAEDGAGNIYYSNTVALGPMPSVPSAWPLSAITNAGTMAARSTGDFALAFTALPWSILTNAPAIGTGDMTSNVFVSGAGVVGTAAVAQAWTGAAATWSTQAANTVTGGLNTARIVAAEVTNESNRVRVTAAEVTNEANRVRIVAAEVTNAANTAAIASTGALLAARSFGVLAGCTNLGDSTNLTIYGTHLCYLASPSNDYKITVDSGAARINYRIDIRSSSNVAYASGVSLYGAWTRTGTNCVIVSPDTGTLWQVRGKGE